MQVGKSGDCQGMVKATPSRLVPGRFSESASSTELESGCGHVEHCAFWAWSSILCLTFPEKREAYLGICLSNCCMEHRSLCPVDRALSVCMVHGTRKVVNYTVP